MMMLQKRMRAIRLARQQTLAGWLETKSATKGRRHANRACAIGGMRGRHIAGGHSRSRATAGASRGFGNIPRVGGGAKRLIGGDGQRGKLGGIGGADKRQTGFLQSPNKGRRALGLLMQSGMRAIATGKTWHIDQVLVHKRRARERRFGVGFSGLDKRLLEAACGQSVKLWLERFGSGDTRLYQLTGADVPRF